MTIADNLNISSNGETNPVQYVPQKLVNVQFNYPEDYAGTKRFKEGEIQVGVSEESAALFVKGGYGTILTDEDVAALQAGTVIEKEAEDTGNTDTDNVKKKPYTAMNKAELKAELTSREISFDEDDTNPELVQLLKGADDAE